MKKSVIVTPNLGFSPGHARGILTQINAASIAQHDDGTLHTELTDDQIAAFRLKAPMHRIDVQADAPAASPEAAEGLGAWREATNCETPEEFTRHMANFQVRYDGQREIWEGKAISLSSQVDAWKQATGVETPEEFIAVFEAKAKAK